MCRNRQIERKGLISGTQPQALLRDRYSGISLIKNHATKNKRSNPGNHFALRLPSINTVHFSMVADPVNHILSSSLYSPSDHLEYFDSSTLMSSWSDDEEVNADTKKTSHMHDIQFYLQNQLHMQHLLYLNTLQQCLSCGSYHYNNSLFTLLLLYTSICFSFSSSPNYSFTNTYIAK